MATTLSTTTSDPYLELVLSFPLRPIRTRAVYEQGKTKLRSLMGKRGAAVRDYKTVLASLIVDYERSANLRLDTSNVTAAQIVIHLLEQQGMSVNALAKLVGISQSSLSDMLNGRRDWSKQAIVRLSAHFGLQAGLFLR
jgi:antitoxin component HigA of HigAB toxin-antitoxin module